MPETTETTPSLDISAAAQSYRVTFKSILLPILVSAVALGLIVYFTYKPGMFGLIVSVFKPSVLLIACLILVVRVMTGAERLRFISNGVLPFKSGLKTQIIWDFYSNVTPSVIGGAPFAAMYMNKDAQVKMGDASAIMMFAMLLDQVWFALSVPIMLIGSMFVEVIPKTVGTLGKGAFTVYFISLMLWVGLFAYGSIIKPEVLQKTLGWICSFGFLKRFKPRVDTEMVSLRARSEIIRKQPLMFFIRGIFYTAVIWICRYLLLLFIIKSVADVQSDIQIILRAMAIMSSYIISPTPGGAGGIEGFYSLFMSPLIDPAFVAPTLFVWRFLGFYIFIIIGAFLTIRKVQPVKPVVKP